MVDGPAAPADRLCQAQRIAPDHLSRSQAHIRRHDDRGSITVEMVRAVIQDWRIDGDRWCGDNQCSLNVAADLAAPAP